MGNTVFRIITENNTVIRNISVKDVWEDVKTMLKESIECVACVLEIVFTFSFDLEPISCLFFTECIFKLKKKLKIKVDYNDDKKK